MLEILKGSFFVRCLLWLSVAYDRSRLARLVKRMAHIWHKSLVFKLLNKYFNRYCAYEHSLLYKALSRITHLIDRFMRPLGRKLNRLFRGSIFCRAVRNISGYGLTVLIFGIVVSGALLGGVLGVAFWDIGDLAVDMVLVMGVIAFITAAALVLTDYTVGLYILSAYAVIDFVLRNYVPAFAGMWDEAYFLGLVLLCVWKWAAHRHDCRGMVYSPMDMPILGFMAVMVFVFLVNSPDPKISLEGLRVVVQYILWYYVVIRLVKNNDKAVLVSRFFAVVVGLMALHGIYQFIVGVEMPAGWVDQNEAGVRTRVFSILTSPNIFGSLLTLGAPVSLGLALGEKNKLLKIIFGGAALAMMGSLLFTFSRGAWIGFAVAFAVYVLIKDARLLAPGIIAAVLVILLVPSVGNRITYMLSPEYIESSLRGGRLVRWMTGARVLSFFPAFGVGLGHFGGAVAMNHGLSTLLDGEYTETFYMDNYYLKTAVETGIVGLAAMLGLMYCVIINSLRTVSAVSGKRMKELSAGITAGLTGVIVHNFVENVFEVPLMCTVFWLFVGIIMAIWYHERRDRIREMRNREKIQLTSIEEQKRE
ncbi:MAG: O-antigen ligase family protein [Firmicutes bacterium]|nr:O-antigen ligase family protein [Bacillota bacterium]